MQDDGEDLLAPGINPKIWGVPAVQALFGICCTFFGKPKEWMLPLFCCFKKNQGKMNEKRESSGNQNGKLNGNTW